MHEQRKQDASQLADKFLDSYHAQLDDRPQLGVLKSLAGYAYENMFKPVGDKPNQGWKPALDDL